MWVLHPWKAQAKLKEPKRNKDQSTQIKTFCSSFFQTPKQTNQTTQIKHFIKSFCLTKFYRGTEERNP